MKEAITCPNCGEKTLHKGSFLSSLDFEPFPSPNYPDIILSGYLCTASDCFSFYPEDSEEVEDAQV